MRRKSITAALVFLAFGIWYGYQTSHLTERTLPNTPGPSFFPWILTISLLILAAVLFIQGMMSPPSGDSADNSSDRVALQATLSGLGLFVIYLAVLPFAGFLIASIPFFAGLMVISGERRVLLIVIAAIAIPVFLYFLFQEGFQILLPRGTLLG